MTYYLGIDGGATKTEVSCVSETGEIIGVGLSGPTNLSATLASEARFNLEQALAEALREVPKPVQVKRAVMGLAGFDSSDEGEEARRVFDTVFSQAQVESWTVVNDTLIALESGTDNPNAIVLIAGTGSNCYGRNQQGEHAHTGGMDFLLSDEGSGYALGIAVLRAAVKSADGRGQKTLLEDMVKQYFLIDSIAQLKTKVYNPPMTKREIAQIAKICLDAATQKDAVAMEILAQVIVDLERMVTVVMQRLTLLSVAFDLVLVGGVVQQQAVHEALLEKLRAVNPQINPIFPQKSPVHGAVKMALRSM